MQIKPITNSEEWLSTVYRGARAKNMDGKEAAESLIILLLRTQYIHNWLYILPTGGRKNKSNRLFKAAAKYFYSLSGPDRIKLVEEYFDIDWSNRKLKTIYQSMLDDDDLIRY